MKILKSMQKVGVNMNNAGGTQWELQCHFAAGNII